jgi:hypothetical protein
VRRTTTALLVAVLLATSAGTSAATTPATVPAVAAVGGAAYRMEYVSTSVRGAPRVVTGSLLVPPGPAPAGGFPVLAWGHGTTGSADACVPSASPDLGGYGTVPAAFVAAGYAVAATDYEGLGVPGPHAYLISGSAGRGVIDAVRAARQVGPALSARWVASGHSQGSQAVAAAAELAGTCGRGLELAGTLAFAAPIDLADSMVRRLGQVEGDFGSQSLYLLIHAGLKTRHPELRYRDYLGPQAAETVSLVETTCLPGIYAEFAARDLPHREFQPVDAKALRRLQDWLALEGIPGRRAVAPLRVLAGDRDEVVGPVEASRAVAEMCALGSNASIGLYRHVDHEGVVPAGTAEAVEWLKARTAGVPVPDTC